MCASGCMEKTVQHKSIRIINVQLEIFSRPSLSTLSVHYLLSWCFLSSFIAITVITTFNETRNIYGLCRYQVALISHISCLSCRGKKKGCFRSVTSKHKWCHRNKHTACCEAYLSSPSSRISQTSFWRWAGFPSGCQSTWKEHSRSLSWGFRFIIKTNTKALIVFLFFFDEVFVLFSVLLFCVLIPRLLQMRKNRQQRRKWQQCNFKNVAFHTRFL